MMQPNGEIPLQHIFGLIPKEEKLKGQPEETLRGVAFFSTSQAPVVNFWIYSSLHPHANCIT